MTSKQEIGIDTAKEQLKLINKMLNSGHVLIGGLAVQQYYIPRDTRDIDLVCDSATAKLIIAKLYPSKHYDIFERNDDEYRPSFEIIHKINKNKVIFFGPKIKERESYSSVDWAKLEKDSNPFKYKHELYENIRVPKIESLAFIKLLSFVDRIAKNKDKGERDLADFIELTNHNDFVLNELISQIRESSTESYIKNKLVNNIEYDRTLWNNSLLHDLFQILAPALNLSNSTREVFKDNFDRLYTVDEALDFYQSIANKYDERNTKVVLETHRRVIRCINEQIEKNKSLQILDIGAGTGRLIALQYFDHKNIRWQCVEPSANMAAQFESTMKSAKIDYAISQCSIFELNKEIKSQKYDVIILSLVLSSLPKDPDFGILRSLLNPGGIMIVTDFYESSPYYNFEYEDSKIALYTRKVKFIDLLKQCLDKGFVFDLLDTFENKSTEENIFILKLSTPH